MTAAGSDAIDLPASRRWLGLACGLGAALFFSIGTVLAPTVYAAGATPAAIVAIRLSLILPALLGFALIMRRPIRLPRRERTVALGLGAAALFQTLCFFFAISLIPISLAILVEFLYPMLVVLAMRLLFGEPLTALKLGAVAAGIAGVGLALQVDMGGLQLLGVLFAMGSALGVATKLVAGGWLLRSSDTLRLLIHMQLAGFLLVWPLFGLTGQIALPETTEGAMALVGMAVMNGVGMLLSFTAITMVGATQTAAAQTSEPILTISFAALLLGEMLSPQRIAGAVLVIGALMALQFARARRGVNRPAG